MISREPNLPRKAMRVRLPLQVEIAGRSYRATDWSTTGLALAELDNAPQPGERIAARLGVPLRDSTLLVPVQLLLRSVREGAYGFEFEDLSPRNKRILRQYIELSLEGRLGDMDEVVAATAAPSADDVPHAPLTLQGPATRSHGGRLAGSVLAGLAVLATAAGIVYYNLTYQLEGTGFVAGSIARVTANHEGRVARLLVHPGARVEPDTPLFTVEAPALRNEIEAMEQHLAELATERARLSAQRRSAEAGLLTALRREWNARQGELANAQRLLAAGAITQRELMLVANQVNELRTNYLKQVADGASRTQSLEHSDAISRLRVELAAKKVLLVRQEAERVVRAPVRGKVFHVDRRAGEFVAAQDPVVLLEADVTPSVYLRVPNDHALKLKLGMPATIYVPFEDRNYTATVSAVGLAAATAAAAVIQEGDTDQTLVRLDFVDRKVRLPANARVNVWIRNPALPWS